MRSVTDTATLRELTERIIAKANIRVSECRLNLRDDADMLPEREREWTCCKI